MVTKNKENGYHELFELTVDKRASDLHLWVPSPPVLRIDGVLTPLSEFAPANPEYIEMVFNEITKPEQKFHTKSHPLMNWSYQKSAEDLFSSQGDSSWSPDLPAAASLPPWLL